MDPRVAEHARIIVEWSAEIKKGDKVIIRATPETQELVVALNRELARVGAHPVTLMELEEASRAYIDAASEETLQEIPDHVKALYENSDAIVMIRSPANTRAMAGADQRKLVTLSKAMRPMSNVILSKRWTVTVHPCNSLAQQANMSLEEYRDFVYGATLLDWKEESKLMYVLKEHLERHSDVRFVGPETDLYAKTEGRIWIASDGKHNLPSGEVFTAPIEDTVEGKIFFDIPFMQRGKVIQGVRLTFEKGEVVDFSAEKEEATLKSIIETDEGSRRLGEMAIGTNRGIQKYTLNMLFDEKIGDTIHCALGNAYKECNGRNESAVHVDMIKSMKEGEVIAGDEVIYSKGKYLWEM
ncbi:MAG: aminopeptidase [Candidatus Thorarchaeota archaeon]|nr:aminopeptidase [Candidatus Thorarchaeota archaeon]